MKHISDIRSIAYCPILYGKEFLKQAIQSVEPFVERIIMLYTEKPSYGHGTDVDCPETEEELKAIALSASPKVFWVKGNWGQEGEHRNEIYKYADDYDIIISFDADEVFNQEDLPKAIEFIANGDKRNYGVNGYINFWKTFDLEVKDFYRPIRFINLKNEWGTEGEVMQRIYHFSCCQSDEIMRYKYLVHGHASELKNNWLEEKYFGWNPRNQLQYLHPVALDIWGDAFPFDKTTLPQSLKDHPRYQIEFPKEIRTNP